MKAQHSLKTWNQTEFLAYLLLYAAHADNEYAESEQDYILSRVAYPTYSKIWKEYSADNDYQHIQKILAFRRTNQTISYKFLMNEIEDLFLADSYLHGMEAYMLNTVRQLLA